MQHSLSRGIEKRIDEAFFERSHALFTENIQIQRLLFQRSRFFARCTQKQTFKSFSMQIKLEIMATEEQDKTNVKSRQSDTLCSLPTSKLGTLQIQTLGFILLLFEVFTLV